MGKGKVIAIRNEVHLLAYTYLNNLRKQDNVAFGSQDVDETSSSDDGLSSPQVSERARYLLHYMQEMRLIRQSEEGPEESEEEQDHVAHHDPLGLFNQDEEDIVAPAAFIDSKQLGSPPAVAGSVSEEEQECLVRLDTDVIVDNGRDFEDSPKPAFSLEELATFGLPLRPTRYFHVRAPVLLFSDQITHISYNFQLFRKTGMLLHWEGTNCCYKRYVFVRHANMSKLRQSFIRNWKQCSKKLK